VIEHDALETIAQTDYRIIYPCSIDVALTTSIWKELRKRGGWEDVREYWVKEVDREDMLEKRGLFFSLTKPLIIIPVKHFRLAFPVVTIDEMLPKILYQLRKHNALPVAVAEFLWATQRYSLEDYHRLTESLEINGIEVHEYQQ